MATQDPPRSGLVLLFKISIAAHGPREEVTTGNSCTMIYFPQKGLYQWIAAEMNFNDIYKNLYTDIKQKKYFLIITFFIICLAAALSTFNSPELKIRAAEMINTSRHVAGQEYQSKSLLYIIFDIFVHNAVTAFEALFTGVLFSFGAILFAVANGYIIGFVVTTFNSDIGRVLPHAVFELLSLILACSYGIWLGTWPFKSNKFQAIKHRLMQCAKIYICVIVPLLRIAAAIEGVLIKSILRQ